MNNHHFLVVNTTEIQDGEDISDLEIWDLETNAIIQMIPNVNGEFFIAGISPDGKYLAGKFGKSIYVWDILTGEITNQFEQDIVRYPERIVFSPDSKNVAFIGTQELLGYGNTYFILNFEDGNIIQSNRWTNDFLTNFEFSPDANHVLISSRDGYVYLVDLRIDEWVYELNIDSYNIYATFSPDGSYFAVSHKNGFDIIETETGEMMYSFGIGDVSWVDFTPSGNIVMVVQGKTIQFWDIFALENLYTLQTPSFINSAKFNDEGNLIITEMGDGTVRIFGVP